MGSDTIRRGSSEWHRVLGAAEDVVRITMRGTQEPATRQDVIDAMDRSQKLGLKRGPKEGYYSVYSRDAWEYVNYVFRIPAEVPRFAEPTADRIVDVTKRTLDIHRTVIADKLIGQARFLSETLARLVKQLEAKDYEGCYSLGVVQGAGTAIDVLVARIATINETLEEMDAIPGERIVAIPVEE